MEAFEGLLFFYTTGIDCVCKSRSRRNPSSRSASPKVEEKVCFSFASCLTPRRGLSRSSRYLKYIPRKRFTSSAGIEKN